MPSKIVVNNVFSRIYGIVPNDIENALKEKLKYTVKDYEHVVRALNQDTRLSSSAFDGTIYLYFPRKGHMFYTGMMSDVLKLLDAAKFDYTIDDRRIKPARNLTDMKFVLPPNKFERPYQNFVVKSMLKPGRGIMQAATGSGKTFMVTMMIGQIGCGPFLFFVPSKDLLDQAHSCLSDCLTVPIGIIGDNQCDIQSINVVMIQTAIKAIKRNDPRFKISDYAFDEEDGWDSTPIDDTKAQAIDNLIKNAAGVYIDECHHAASRSCQAIMEACSNAYWRYGGSATPFREDGAEKMLQALFGKVIINISASWLIRKKYLVKPYIFNVRIRDLPGNWKSYPEVYRNHIVENNKLNELVVRIVMKMRQANIPSLVLVKQYPHGNTLRKMMPDVPFIKGDMARSKRREAIASLRDGSLSCAIATTLADEGLDVERLGCVVVAGGGKSITRVYQRVGRALRSFQGKDRAVVFLFHHENAQFLDGHGRRVINILKKEPEFSIIESSEDSVLDDINDFLNPGNASSVFG